MKSNCQNQKRILCPLERQSIVSSRTSHPGDRMLTFFACPAVWKEWDRESKVGERRVRRWWSAKSRRSELEMSSKVFSPRAYVSFKRFRWMKAYYWKVFASSFGRGMKKKHACPCTFQRYQSSKISLTPRLTLCFFFSCSLIQSYSLWMRPQKAKDTQFWPQPTSFYLLLLPNSTKKNHSPFLSYIQRNSYKAIYIPEVDQSNVPVNIVEVNCVESRRNPSSLDNLLNLVEVVDTFVRSEGGVLELD